MRHFLLPIACLFLLTGCSVDRYALKVKVVSDPRSGAESMRSGKADKLAQPGVPRAMVRLIIDPEHNLSRKELGAFSCDADGRFEVRDIYAPGVEIAPYTLRVEAYAPHCQPMRADIDLPSPGRTLVLRLAPSDGSAPQGFKPPAPGTKAGDDYLQNTLKESEPYLNGGK